MENTATLFHATNPAVFPPGGFVRLRTILTIIPVSKSLLWEMVARGDFPKPVKLSHRVTAWRCSDIAAFIASHD